MLKFNKGQYHLVVSEAVIEQHERAKKKGRRRIEPSKLIWKPPVFSRCALPPLSTTRCSSLTLDDAQERPEVRLLGGRRRRLYLGNWLSRTQCCITAFHVPIGQFLVLASLAVPWARNGEVSMGTASSRSSGKVAPAVVTASIGRSGRCTRYHNYKDQSEVSGRAAVRTTRPARDVMKLFAALASALFTSRASRMISGKGKGRAEPRSVCSSPLVLWTGADRCAARRLHCRQLPHTTPTARRRRPCSLLRSRL